MRYCQVVLVKGAVQIVVHADDAQDKEGPRQWTTAGVRDYWLGGSHHTVADREIAERILVGAPYLPYMVRVYRELLERVVRYLVEVGIKQFLDLGSGLPTESNVHQVAQALDSRCRVVYVDSNPLVLNQSHALLSDNDRATVICADLRQPEQVVGSATRTGLLDLSAPVAVLLIDILHHIPDVDNPAGFIHTYVDMVCPGSYLVVAHTNDEAKDIEGSLTMVRTFYHRMAPPLTFRHPMQVADFLTGLDIIEPGVVPLPLWRPDHDDTLDSDPEIFPAWCALARKPGLG
jgi:hypothetical protein